MAWASDVSTSARRASGSSGTARSTRGSTAAVLFVAQAHSEPPLHRIVEMAHRRRIPVIVDAAAQLPPASNLKRFIAEGADLVAFSGGKALGGPQASGILAGQIGRAHV